MAWASERLHGGKHGPDHIGIPHLAGHLVLPLFQEFCGFPAHISGFFHGVSLEACITGGGC